MKNMKTVEEFLNENSINESSDDGSLVTGNVQEFGVRWHEVNNKDQKIMKEKFFDSDKKLKAFVDKLEKKDNFVSVYSYTRPE